MAWRRALLAFLCVWNVNGLLQGFPAVGPSRAPRGTGSFASRDSLPGTPARVLKQGSLGEASPPRYDWTGAPSQHRRYSAPAMALQGVSKLVSCAAAMVPGFAAGGLALPPAVISNSWYIWSVIMCGSAFGLWSEKTQWGAALSSPLVTMLLTITMCNIGLLPSSSGVYTTVNKVFVPLAVPLLLFDGDLRRVMRYAGTLLACFALGALGTVVGTLVGTAAVPLGMGADGWKIAAALASRHIGGAVNYVAVAETLEVSADAVVAGLAADNLVVSLYFIFLFWVTKSGSPAGEPSSSAAMAAVAADDTGGLGGMDNGSGNGMSKESLSYALSAGCVLCFLGELIAKGVFGGRVSAIPITTLLTVGSATLMPRTFGRLGAVGAQVGVLLMQVFFAVTGAQGSLAVVVGTAPALLLFSFVQIAVHFLFLVGTGRLARLPFPELALASNANVGGPTTAAAMAAAKQWKNLVLPALLTGILGYATATFIGVGLGQAALRGMSGF